LKEESLTRRIKMKELMDMYSETLDLEKFSARRALPLLRQLKNLYKKKPEAFSPKTKISRRNCNIFKDELAHRNLNVLVEAAIERDEPTVKKSTPAVKRNIPA